jgi:hypothetical protein
MELSGFGLVAALGVFGHILEHQDSGMMGVIRVA